MKELTFTFFENKRAAFGNPVTLPWMEWVEALVDSHDVRDEKDGGAVVLGMIPEKTRRAKKNVAHVSAIGIDIEHKTQEQIAAVLEKLNPFEFVSYTTYSHTDEEPRHRVIVPFSESVDPSTYPDVWVKVNRFVLMINDPSTKDASRLHFLPSCPTGPNPPYSHHNSTGRFLSLADLDAEDTVDDIRKRLSGLRKGELKDIADKLRKGEAYAAEGKRHDKTLKITMWLANKARPLKHAEFDELFAPSVAAMSWDLEEAWVCYDTAVDKVVDEMPSTSPPTDEELVALADLAKKQGKKSWTELDWVLQAVNGVHYILRPNGHYGCYDKSQVETFLHKHLAHSPIEMVVMSDKGPKLRTVRDIVREHGQMIDSIILDMNADFSKFEEGTFIEAVCRQQSIKPEWNEEIDGWLQVFAGDHYDAVCDWLASAPMLDRPLCALYLKGPKGCGKSLFATALAQLWSDTAVELHNIFDNFNESLVRCPIVVGEEAVPRSWRGMPSTTRLRALITEPNRELLRKYKAPATMKGYIRLILTSNNDELLRGDMHTAEDLDAIAQRFLMISAPEESAKYLLKVKDVDAWRREKLFAKHVLFLSENLPVEKAGRFWVEGNAEEMSIGLMVGSHWNSRVCHWLVSYLMNPDLISSGLRDAILRQDREFYVNERALLDFWTHYFPHTKEEPDIERISAALRTVSLSGNRVKVGGSVIRYHHIDPDKLLRWIDRTGIGDHETILAAIAAEAE